MTTTTPVLRLRDVHKRYGPRTVLKGADLDAAPGRLIGVVGENGAGKSTLLRILAGELRADRGTVRLPATVGHCPQTVVLHHALTVAQHLRYFQVAYGLPEPTRAWELLEELRFAAGPRDRTGTLSGGTRQKLNLAVALMHDPELLLLDEPYQGFDWETYLRFWEIARSLRERGRTVLVVSHMAHDADRLDALHRLVGGRLTPVHDGGRA
ncbi:ABC transporter [Streptomyces albidoflavus]|uniref:ABC transporter ATP-binding protein n=1 Tax=Streptomyces albidoflavus TaxID=1886 RepID=UPI00101E3A16|nr:ABC transporter ATP-binding protein [Streptomyces albidoflavus]RZE70037.1 ABC transporter [Streptomyces albidoflavus]RZE86087.1 ABC transporter [Streptomyces albidoflavus]